MDNEIKRKYLRSVIWFNLLVGFQNMWFYAQNDSLINLVIGSLNIGVWVFNRNILWQKKEEKKK